METKGNSEKIPEVDQETEMEAMEVCTDPTPHNDITMEAGQLQQSAMDKVFGNNMLRKKILEHVLYSDSARPNNVNYADLPNVRVVQKNWLSTISTILLELRHSLYSFSEDFHLLPSFVEMITHPKRSEQFIPPFSVTLACDFFTPENQDILRKFLVTCAPGLTSLHLMIPKNCSMSFILPEFSLSILQQLTIEFTSHSLSTMRHGNPMVAIFIQQLLNSTSELKTLEFTAPSDTADSSVIPQGLELLSIPETITALRMKCPFLANHLNMMIPSNNTTNYARITELELMASETPMTGNTIYNILARHSATLKTLTLSGKHDLADVIEPTVFRIPEMKHLETLIVSSPIWKCADDLHMYSSNFPKLKTIQMKKITVSLFEKLTNLTKTRLRFVSNVEISLVNELLPEEYFDSSVNLEKEKIQRIHCAFRNVTKLDISIRGVETSGLKYIFFEMVKLTSLAINVKHSIPSLSRSDWDGLMIGTPRGLAEGLVDTPDFWESLEMKEDAINHPPITRLTELVHLTLASVNSPIFYDFENGMRGRLISEVSFYFAFFRMPQLKGLHLFGLFDPSEAMIAYWRDYKESEGAEPIVHGLER